MLARILGHAARTPSQTGLPGVPRRIDDEIALPREFDELRIADRFSRMAVLAAWEATQSAARWLPPNARFACIFSTTFNTRASVEAWLTSLLTRPNPLLFPSATSAVTIGHIARALQIRRSVTVLNSTSPLPVALRWLASGRERYVLLVATEELVGSAPAALARQEPATQFAEATAAAIIAADTPAYAGCAAIGACETAARASDGDISSMAAVQALGEAMAQLPPTFANGFSRGLCSAGVGGRPLPSERGEFAALRQPRESIGDTLGASSIVAIVDVLENAGPGPRHWVLNDVDRAGGALSACLELP